MWCRWQPWAIPIQTRLSDCCRSRDILWVFVTSVLQYYNCYSYYSNLQKNLYFKCLSHLNHRLWIIASQLNCADLHKYPLTWEKGENDKAEFPSAFQHSPWAIASNKPLLQDPEQLKNLSLQLEIPAYYPSTLYLLFKSYLPSAYSFSLELILFGIKLLIWHRILQYSCIQVST